VDGGRGIAEGLETIEIRHPFPMKIQEIAFSCYPVTDMARARSFYEGILGLQVTMDHQMGEAHWVEYDLGTGTLAIGVAPGMEPSRDGCSVALEVDDFDQAVRELREAGVEFNFGPLETPVCHMAFVRDPDGNSVGIHKRKAGHC
jgi:predicted enzyme related to lactoylglutathione lyase